MAFAELAYAFRVHHMNRHTLHVDCDESDDEALATFLWAKVSCPDCLDYLPDPPPHKDES